jgi:ATP-dependent DNA ligase
MSRRQGIMLCYPFEERRLASWGPPYLVQPKLDGVRCRALPLGQSREYTLLSSEENIIFGMKHIEVALDALPFTTELDGELYCHGLSFEEIFSRTSRSENYHPDANQIGYYIFDICDEHMPQLERTKWLQSQSDYIRPPLWNVTTMVATTLSEVMECMEVFVDAGYEGIIVRDIDASYVRKRSTRIMKFKPKKRDEYPIIGYKEEISKDGAPKGSLGALVCMSDGEEFSVGTGFTESERQGLWMRRDELVGRTCIVAYQHTTLRRGVPRFPVKVSIKP